MLAALRDNVDSAAMASSACQALYGLMIFGILPCRVTGVLSNRRAMLAKRLLLHICFACQPSDNRGDPRNSHVSVEDNTKIVDAELGIQDVLNVLHSHNDAVEVMTAAVSTIWYVSPAALV